ncbi:hypothetical protein ACLKA7_013147 [Drosophila subpalustris]
MTDNHWPAAHPFYSQLQAPTANSEQRQQLPTTATVAATATTNVKDKRDAQQQQQCTVNCFMSWLTKSESEPASPAAGHARLALPAATLKLTSLPKSTPKSLPRR